MSRSSLLAGGAAVVVAILGVVAAIFVLGSSGGDGPRLDLALGDGADVVVTVILDDGLGVGETIELARIAPDAEVTVIAETADLAPVVDTGLEPVTQYSYRVRVVGGVEDGEWSTWTPITTGATDSDEGAAGERTATEVTLGEGNSGEEPDLEAPLPSLTDIDLAIRPTMLDFGPLEIGEQRDLEVAVFNNSDVPFNLGGITIAGVGYSVDGSSCAPEIAGRSSCAIIVTFTPQREGLELAVLSSSTRGALAQASGDGKTTAGDTSLTVTVVGTGGGGITSAPAGLDCSDECTATFEAGAEVTLTATPAEGSQFLGWSGVDCAPGATCNVTIDGAKNVLAVFDIAPPSASLTVDVGGSGSGSVVSNPTGISCPGTCTADFAPGTQVTLDVVADDGSTFAGWRGGDCQAEGSCTVAVTGTQSLLAVFEQGAGSARLQVEIVGLGTGSIVSSPAGVNCPAGECAANFAAGTQVTLTPSPDAGSEFVGWSGGGCQQDNDVCVTTVDAVTNVLAEFGVP